MPRAKRPRFLTDDHLRVLKTIARLSSEGVPSSELGGTVNAPGVTSALLFGNTAPEPILHVELLGFVDDAGGRTRDLCNRGWVLSFPCPRLMSFAYTCSDGVQATFQTTDAGLFSEAERGEHRIVGGTIWAELRSFRVSPTGFELLDEFGHKNKGGRPNTRDSAYDEKCLRLWETGGYSTYHDAARQMGITEKAFKDAVESARKRRKK